MNVAFRHRKRGGPLGDELGIIACEANQFPAFGVEGLLKERGQRGSRSVSGEVPGKFFL